MFPGAVRCMALLMTHLRSSEDLRDIFLAILMELSQPRTFSIFMGASWFWKIHARSFAATNKSIPKYVMLAEGLNSAERQASHFLSFFASAVQRSAVELLRSLPD